jgi:hypothetical protein
MSDRLYKTHTGAVIDLEKVGWVGEVDIFIGDSFVTFDVFMQDHIGCITIGDTEYDPKFSSKEALKVYVEALRDDFVKCWGDYLKGKDNV